MQNPFADLIPQQQNAASSQSTGSPPPNENPFADLIPQKNVPRETQNPKEKRGFLNNLARQSAAIVGSAGLNIAKDFLPSTLNQFAPGAGDIMKHASPIYGKGKDIDLYKQLGVEKGIGSDILQGSLEFAPYYAGAGGALNLLKSAPKAAKLFEGIASKYPGTSKFTGEVAQNALAGAGMAANNEQNVGVGALLGAASVPLGYAITAPLKYGAKSLAQSAIPGLTERATEKLKTLFDPNDYAARLKDVFVSKYKENTGNWNAVDNLAKKMDDSLTKDIPVIKKSKLVDEAGNPLETTSYEKGVNFDSSPYVGYIDKFLSRVKKLEPAKQAEYKDAIDFAEYAKKIAPKSFSGSLSLRKEINNQLQDFLGQKGVPSANRQAKEFIKGLKENLSGETIALNSQKLGEGAEKGFTSAWDKANKSHTELQEFFKSKNPLGNVEEKRALKKAFKSGEISDAAILDQFMPGPKQTGVGGLNQLKRLFGSKEEAQNAAKAYLNRRPLQNGNTVLDASTEYAKLSPKQRDWIYGGSPEGKLLGTINKIRTEFGKEPERSFYKMFSHPASAMIAPALFGSAAGYYTEDSGGALAGAAIPLIASALSKKVAGNLSPKSIEAAMKYSKSSTPNRGRNVNALFQSLYEGGNQ